jgi:hypothetical protein
VDDTRDPSRRVLLGGALAAALAVPAAARGKDRKRSRPKPPQVAVIATVQNIAFEVADARFRILVAVKGQDLRSDPPESFDFGLSTAVDFAPAARMQQELVARIQDAVATDDDLPPGIQRSRVAVFVLSDPTP